jgi:type II secretory pathway component PulK
MPRPASATGVPPQRRAVVLLLVLVVVVVLTLAAYRYSESMTAEYKAADSANRAIQVQALADSGIYYTAALLSNPATFAGVLNSSPLNNRQALWNILVQPDNHPRFRGRFSIIALPGPDEPAGSSSAHRYGVTDEASKINLNAFMVIDPSGKALRDRLMALPNMTEEIADAIVDWLDANNKPRKHGAEEEYYQSMNPPYHCKNGPLDSLEELLLVRGVTPELLFGNDRNRNGVLDPDENDGSGFFDRGWSAYLTIYSREQDIDSQLNTRIYVNGKDVKALYDKLISAVGLDLAYYIAAYRLYGPAINPAQQLKLHLTLIDTELKGSIKLAADSSESKESKSTSTPKAPAATPSKSGQSSSSAGATKKPSSTSSAEPSQPKKADHGERDDLDFSQKPAKSIDSLYELIGTSVNIPNKEKGMTHYDCPLNDEGTLRQLLPLLLDRATTRSDTEIPARININTAPLAVLAALPGLSETDVQSILEHRPDPLATQPPDAIFQTPAWLITEANFSPKAMMQLDKFITTRSQTYRVQAIGYFDRDGPSARVEAVIDTNCGRPRIVYRRDLTELTHRLNLEKGN